MAIEDNCINNDIAEDCNRFLMMMLYIYHHLHTLVLVSGPQVAVLLHRLYPYRQHDVIQCCDWLGVLRPYIIQITWFGIRHQSCLRVDLAKLRYLFRVLNRSASKAFHIVQRGSNNLLGVGSVSSTNTRARA